MKKIFLITIYFLIIHKGYSQRFNEIVPAIHGINQGNIMWGDYDGDSDLDVFAVGGIRI